MPYRLVWSKRNGNSPTFVGKENHPTLMYLTGNKQEWAKIYAWFTLITRGSLSAGNRKLEAKPDSDLTVRRISRALPDGSLTLTPLDAHTWNAVRRIVDAETGEASQQQVEIPTSRFAAAAELIKARIAADEESFDIDEAETLLEEMGVYDFYSSSEEGEDLTVLLHDARLDAEVLRKVRFRSLLSRLYLLEANRASNFKFDIIQSKFSRPEVNKINAIGDSETGSIHRLNEVFRLGGKLKYSGVEGGFFLNAMQLIDMHLPKLMSEMVRLFYTGESITVSDLTTELNAVNLFKVKEEVIQKSRIYEYKIRQLLYAASTGLKPTKTWRGNGNTHYQIYVAPSGELLGYDPTEKEEFEKFLFANTRLSLPNEDKNKFGSVERENGQWLIKLNLEIRFK